MISELYTYIQSILLNTNFVDILRMYNLKKKVLYIIIMFLYYTIIIYKDILNITSVLCISFLMTTLHFAI